MSLIPRERKDREIAAMDESVPLALQYIYGGSTVVQGEKDHTNEVYKLNFFRLVSILQKKYGRGDNI